jgi:radical SAM superfamily enzyme YgiQ (UPF0313 family)
VLAEAFVAGIEGDFDVEDYEWIGFSILSDTLPTTLGVIELIRKKYPTAKIVGGNHESTVNLSDCIGKSHLDGVILADAEKPMLALMRGDAPHLIPGVLWRTHNPKPSREDFEEWNAAIKWGEIPYEAYWERTSALYDWDKMSAEEALDKKYEIHTVRIHSLVACELACTYCSVANTRRIASGSMKPSIVNMSTDALAATLLEIKAQVPGVMTIYDSCDEAWLGRGRAEEYLGVLEAVRPAMDEGLPRGLRYLVQCRTNDLTQEIIERAARVGVRHLTIGVESPVAQVRKDIKKRLDDDHFKSVGVETRSDGVFFTVDGELMPHLAWSNATLANLAQVLNQLYPPGTPLPSDATYVPLLRHYVDNPRVHPEPVFLCTVIKNLDENSQLYAKAS